MFNKKDQKIKLLDKAKKIEEEYNKGQTSFSRKEIQVLFELLGIQFKELNNLVLYKLDETIKHLEKQELGNDK